MNKKILIAEDEAPLLARLQKRFAEDGNFYVLTASDGETAIQLALSEKPDIVLTDIIMPKVHGLNVLKKIREAGEWGKNVPIIMLTNLSDSAVVAEAAERGSFDFLVKEDWTLDEVVTKAKQRLGI